MKYSTADIYELKYDNEKYFLLMNDGIIRIIYFIECNWVIFDDDEINKNPDFLYMLLEKVKRVNTLFYVLYLLSKFVSNPTENSNLFLSCKFL